MADKKKAGEEKQSHGGGGDNSTTVLKPSPTRAPTRPKRSLAPPPVVKGSHIFDQGNGHGKKDEASSAFSFMSVNNSKVRHPQIEIPYASQCNAAPSTS